MAHVTKAILVAVGCFNPPTIMHQRLFEIGRDYLEGLRSHRHKVLGGVISPAHDSYSKTALVSSRHRVEMVRLSLARNPLVSLSKWESEQDQWTPTRRVLDKHRQELHEFATGQGEQKPDWLPPNVQKEDLEDVRLYLLCGEDLLQSFSVPNLWAKDDITTIVRDYGLLVIPRAGSDPLHLVYASDVLHNYRENIHFVHSDMGTDISSTKVRCAVRRKLSIKYLVEEEVVNYIEHHNLYSVEYDSECCKDISAVIDDHPPVSVEVEPFSKSLTACQSFAASSDNDYQTSFLHDGRGKVQEEANSNFSSSSSSFNEDDDSSVHIEVTATGIKVVGGDRESFL